MYGFTGIDDEEALRQLLGTSPLDDPRHENFQFEMPESQGLLGDTPADSSSAEDLLGTSSGIAALMAQLAQQNYSGGGQNRISGLRNASQQAVGQQQQSGGGLLGLAMNFLPWGKWLGMGANALGNAIGKGIGTYGLKWGGK